MKQTEALKLALVALENSEKLFGDPEDRLMTDFDLLQNAITTIREALMSVPDGASEASEQPAPSGEQQEPVAVYVGETWCGSVVRLYDDLPLETPLYTSPQPSKPWRGLTHDEVNSWELPDCPTVFEFAQFIEAKLKEKNA